MPQSIANLVQMAGWRVDQLAWDSQINAKIRAVAGVTPGQSVPKGLRR
jgi:hypothetical protein